MSERDDMVAADVVDLDDEARLRGNIRYFVDSQMPWMRRNGSDTSVAEDMVRRWNGVLTRAGLAPEPTEMRPPTGPSLGVDKQV